MSVLLVDVGNTRIKWARHDGTTLGRRFAAVHDHWSTSDYTRRLFGRRPPQRMLVSSVAGDAVKQQLTAAARKAKVTVQFVRVPRRAAGVTVGYLDTWRLGVDRFVAAVAAHHLFPGVNVCVVGVGTALTIDLLDARGRHHGGAIVPSPSLMVETLLTGTHGIRRRARGGGEAQKGLFARSTRAGVVQGARLAAASLIDRAAQEARTVLKVNKKPLVVLTGGGAAVIRPLLDSPCVGVADLVLRGLAELASNGARASIRSLH